MSLSQVLLSTEDGLPVSGQGCLGSFVAESYREVEKGRSFSFADSKSDVALVESVLESLTGKKASLARDWLIPAVVLTNDDFLPNDSALTCPARVLPLVTVVPLVWSKDLLTPGAPSVPHPKVPTISYAPLTRCLLTLDYQARFPSNLSRLELSGDDFPNWVVEDRTRHMILDDVLALLGA